MKNAFFKKRRVEIILQNRHLIDERCTREEEEERENSKNSRFLQNSNY